jgi:hypothetical protein
MTPGRDDGNTKEELIRVVHDYQRLWEIDGLAALFAARLASPASHRPGTDPVGDILANHRRLLSVAVGDVRIETDGDSTDSDGLADALVGIYLIRRLAGVPLAGWTGDALRLLRFQ